MDSFITFVQAPQLVIVGFVAFGHEQVFRVLFYLNAKASRVLDETVLKRPLLVSARIARPTVNGICLTELQLSATIIDASKIPSDFAAVSHQIVLVVCRTLGCRDRPGPGVSSYAFGFGFVSKLQEQIGLSFGILKLKKIIRFNICIY